MTTIACDRRMMAADSKASAGDIEFRVKKIFRVKRRDPMGSALIGVCGAYDKAMLFIHWYENGAPLYDRPDLGGSVTALVLDRSGIYRYEDQGYPIKIEDDFAAAGTGAPAAMAVMTLNKNPGEAVWIATKVDPASGPPVHVHRLYLEGDPD